jgi:hypothetical protein
MNYTEFGFGRFSSDIEATARKFDLDLENLDVEFFSPGHQAIFVESVGSQRFRIHISLEENRVIAAKQLMGEPDEKSGEDLFAKYKKFMK